MFSASAALVLSAAGVVHTVYGQANHVSTKNTAFANLGFNENGLWNALQPQQSVWPPNQWAWGTLPQFCYKAAVATPGLSNLIHCNPYDIEVYDLQYPDCSNTWTLCRCHNATWSLVDAVDLIGRIPVKARQYTRTWAVFESISGQESATSAYSLGVDTAVFDDPAKDGHSPTLVLHENAHTIDYGWQFVHGTSGLVSASTDFVNAINADACVPDSYAKSNDVEDFAQLTVCASYDKNAGPLSQYGNSACMQNQLNYVENTIGSTSTPGGTCDFYWIKDTVVCMGPAAGCGAQGAAITTTAASAKFKSSARPLPDTNPVLFGTDYEYLVGTNGTKRMTMKKRSFPDVE